MRRLPPRVHVDDLRDPERWLRDHVYTSDETERAYEEQERTAGVCEPKDTVLTVVGLGLFFAGAALVLALLHLWLSQ